ncbi:TPR-like protein [Laetiporus sulphureus 93-53]|uniref:TPR-like protein n=1 Tax=Laetiporus sulphureus 93-53 TaxID=1314785 RepID=A0A165GZ19_9APHY|nr:TPR-like protein [Laetiporus sulphureus 93-53]KZT11024.1 TPR-like protein [Laetiporus sulphureus 93-53]
MATVDANMVEALRNAVRDCGERGLRAASKWAAEQLLSIPKPKRQPSAITLPSAVQTSTSAPAPSSTTQPRHPHAPHLYSLPEDVRRKELQWEAEDADYIAAARTFFDCNDYARAASEKQALREWYKLDIPVNTSLRDLMLQVENATDPFLLFLKALFLQRLHQRDRAIESALLSIAGYPWNWSAWMVLGECLNDGEETLNTLHSPTENELGLCDRLLSEELFPQSSWIMALRASVLYHMHDFKEAAMQFTKILTIDPYRIDDIDIYSNILYVTEDHLTLTKIAHEFTMIDKDRPEVCCLIGNYYSLRSEHAKAIKYFRRATQLDRTYLSAWTLMGHEYVEMKNSHAAIEAYRKAVDVNRKDYRAWYGLGQAYELLSMHQYALHYYQHATALRPYDVRIWQAQGICYEEMARPREAIQCLKRALIGADPLETIIHLKLAKLYNDLDEFAEAAAYHRHVVEVCRAANKPVAEFAKSGVYVARYHVLHGGNDIGLAKEYLEIVASSNAEEPFSQSDSKPRISVPLDASGSTYGSPAPEPLTPAVASTSTFDVDLITVDGEPDDGRPATGSSARVKLEPDVEAISRQSYDTYARNDKGTLVCSCRVASSLAADQMAVLYPDVDAPFSDAADAVRRLLPYHVFHHPKEDLEAFMKRPIFTPQKGKRKATEEDLLREEIAETKFALDCWRRRKALERRFKRACIRSGTRASPDDQAHFLAQAILETEREETINVNAELRQARAQLEKLQREKRAAEAPVPQPRPPASYYAAPSTPTSAYASQYRGYAYPYAHAYGAGQYTLSPAFPTTHAAYTSTPSSTGAYTGMSPYPSTPTPTASYAASSTTYQTATPVATSNAPAATAVTPAQHTPSRPPTSAIPVQLPVTSLPALTAIGLQPVPVSSLPAEGQQRPAAVLKSQTGATMNLEINVGSLQPAQMSGLALILNALTSRGVNVDGTTTAAPIGGTGGSGTPSTSAPASTVSSGTR